MAEPITLTTTDGDMPAYVAMPDGDARGAVVVVQEAFGLTTHIESVCRRLAEAGYTAIAPAFFHRTGSGIFDYGDFESVRPAMMALTAGGIEADLDAALADLHGRGFTDAQIGAVGFCMGGTVALFAGTQWKLGAAVTYYGGGVAQGRFGFPSLLDIAPELQSPWLGLYGDLDQGIPVDEVESLRRVAGAAPVPTEVVRYADAGHGFNCDDRPDAYHAASAADAWGRMLAWFGTYLKQAATARGVIRGKHGGVLTGERVLVTGATGQVALPITMALARDNQVTALARFRDPVARAALETAGVRCIEADIARDDLSTVPDQFDVVLNLAVVKSGRFDLDIAANAEAAGLLMGRVRSARAFLHCSSTGVYEPAGHRHLLETDALGDNHRAIMPTYSIAKIAAEAVVRTGARQWQLPTTIARLNVPYGDNGGWPAFHLAQILGGDPVALHPERPNLFNPIHEDDLIAMIPALLSIASVPATIVNWAGDETVAIEEWCEYMAELVGKDASFVVTDRTIASVTTDNTKLNELVGHSQVSWRDGMARMVAAQQPH